jgi:hypothetical protein
MFTSGKHNNKSFGYVLKNDVKYCIWMLKQPPTTITIRSFQQFLCGKLYNPSISSGNISVTNLSLEFNGHPAILTLLVDHVSEIKTIYKRKLINKFSSIDSAMDSDISKQVIETTFHYSLSLLTRKQFISKKYDAFKDRQSIIVRPYSSVIENKTGISWDIYMEKINSSYERLIHYCGNINDIMNVSLACILPTSANVVHICQMMDRCNDQTIRPDIIEFISSYLEDKISLQNVVYGLCLTSRSLNIVDDYDNWFIVGEELFEIQHNPFLVGEHLNDYIKAFVAIAIISGNKRNNISIRRITIVNTYIGYESSIDIHNEMCIMELVSLLMRR